jgi:hypothetical protein
MDGETVNNLWQLGFLIVALLGVAQVALIWRDTKAAGERKEWRGRIEARQDKLSGDLDAGLGAVRSEMERRTGEMARQQNAFEVEVARTYATNVAVKETEERMRRDIHDVRELMIAGFAEGRTMMMAMNTQLQQLIGRAAHRAE